jgi:L-seryl-tRNA(Ser) seleniumtransferase
MLLQQPEKIRMLARKIAGLLKLGLGSSAADSAAIEVVEDVSQSGGGALAEVPFKTYAVAITPIRISVNDLEMRLRQGNPPVIARIREDRLILDARTVQVKDVAGLVKVVREALL